MTEITYSPEIRLVHKKIITTAVVCTLWSVSAFAFEPVMRDPAKPSEKQEVTKGSPLGGVSIFGDAPLPAAQNGAVVVPALTVPTTAVSKIGTGVLPKDTLAEAKSSVQPIPEGNDRPDFWSATQYAWQASNTFSSPLYFEDVMLERHGHQCDCNYLTPVLSGLRFFATVPALPYLMTVNCPDSQQYTYGHWQPGTCAPKLLQRPPYQTDAAIVEAAAITGGVFLLH
jgi:hypothetical protein